MMTGADLLDAPTGTAVVTWSETGQRILGAKEGKGMWVWSAVVLAVLSSRMSAGGCSLAGRRDNVPPCLAITAISSGCAEAEGCTRLAHTFLYLAQGCRNAKKKEFYNTFSAYRISCF